MCNIVPATNLQHATSKLKTFKSISLMMVAMMTASVVGDPSHNTWMRAVTSVGGQGKRMGQVATVTPARRDRFSWI